MSFQRATARARPPSAAELEKRLAEEFRNPNPTPEAQPIIIAAPAAPASITRLFVICDEWRDLSQQERSEIITNAYEHAESLSAAAQLSIAMGLTTVEAGRMGIGGR